MCLAQTKLLMCLTPAEIKGMWIRGTEHLGLKLFALTLMGGLQQLPFCSMPRFSPHLPAHCFNNTFTTWARVICVVLKANGTIKKKRDIFCLFQFFTFPTSSFVALLWEIKMSSDPCHLYGKYIILIQPFYYYLLLKCGMNCQTGKK